MKEIVTLRVNGDVHEVGVPTHWTLLETLRYALGLTGSKQGCDKGDCGACTVVIDGEAHLSCIMPVWEAEGRDVRTVEGLAEGARPHPLQDAFDLCGAAQCGFCTPGILCSAYGLLEENTDPTRREIQEALSGNLCRCTGYTKIFEAVEVAAEALRTGRPAPEIAAERHGVRPSRAAGTAALVIAGHDVEEEAAADEAAAPAAGNGAGGGAGGATPKEGTTDAS